MDSRQVPPARHGQPDNILCWNFRRTSYANGDKRPLFRGWIHAFVTLGLVPTIVGVIVAISFGILPVFWWRLGLMLMGKLASYAASATYHLKPAASLAKEQNLLKLDLIAISVAIWAPSSAFAMDVSEWLALFGTMIAVTLVNCIVVQRQFGPNGGSPVIRSILLLVYFGFTVGIIGWHYGYRAMWFAGVFSYLGGFCVSPPVHHHLPRAPWHWVDRNGWHEDFHCMLAIADIIFALMAVEFLNNQ
jgi:predicted membrane channel-forming protein YqfA (hemolysin III family)